MNVLRDNQILDNNLTIPLRQCDRNIFSDVLSS